MFIIIKIIAGSNKGFILKTKEGLSTRPTLNRIKENVFNIIREKVVNSNFLDLFAGSGGIALESISRGAARAVLVEKDKKAFAVVKANIDKTKTNDKVIAINSDYKDYLKRSNDKFDLIYIDPPYNLGNGDFIYDDKNSVRRARRRAGGIIFRRIGKDFEPVAQGLSGQNRFKRRLLNHKTPEASQVFFICSNFDSAKCKACKKARASPSGAW